MNKAVIFDLDGTLWDSSEVIPDIWNRVFRRCSTEAHITIESLQALMGRTMSEIGECLFPALPYEYREKIMDECGKEEVRWLKEHGAVLYEGLEETLSELNNDYKLLLVSNCQKDYALAFLTAHNLLTYFTDYEESGSQVKDCSYA